MIKKIPVLLTIFFSVVTYSQKLNSSPYSFFGIGDQISLKSVEESGMGNMGGTLDSKYQLSFTNPASYASLKYTTYVFAGGNKATSFDDGNDKQTSSHASLNYIAMGIPIRGNQAMTFGLQLNTAVGYSLLDQKYGTIDDVEEIIEANLYKGTGGTNRAFLGYGYQFPFNLNLGVEAAYFFGEIDNSILNRQLGVELATKYQVDSYVKGFEFKTGALYKQKIKENLEVKLGTALTIGHDLKNEGDEYLFSLDNRSDGIVIPRDTLYSNPHKTTISYPLRTVVSAGVGEENKWFIGAEYSFMDAIDFNGNLYENQDKYSYDESSMISLGGFYLPKHNSIRSYWDRVTYRAGFNYKKYGLIINDTEIDDYGMSFGVSLPMGVKLSNVNMGIELGKRGDTTNNLVEEKYFNFRLSLSLNDIWFRKRVLD
ncbi:MAG: hypothetical protein ABFR05_04140 [Bacteroidota bacterium]